MIICYHMTIDLAWALRRPPTALGEILRHETGQPLSGWAVRRRLRHAQQQGYRVLPVCAHHDAYGYCLGHREG